MPTDRPDAGERRARVEQMIREYRAAKRQRLLQRAVKLWRRAEARQRFLERDDQPERVH